MSEARSGEERAPEENLFGSVGADKQESTPDNAPNQADRENRDTGHDFDWSTDSGDVVLEEQPRTAIYTNPKGFVVIRQENHCRGNFDDDVVVIAPQNLEQIIIALQVEAGTYR